MSKSVKSGKPTSTFEKSDTYHSYKKALKKFNTLNNHITKLKDEALEVTTKLRHLHEDLELYSGHKDDELRIRKEIQKVQENLDILNFQIKELSEDYEINSHHKAIVKYEKAAVENMKKAQYDYLKTIFDFAGPRGVKSRKQNKKRKTKRRKTNKKY